MSRPPKLPAATRAEITRIVTLRDSLPTITALARQYDLSPGIIRKIAAGYRYKNTHDDDQPNGALPC